MNGLFVKYTLEINPILHLYDEINFEVHLMISLRVVNYKVFRVVIRFESSNLPDQEMLEFSASCSLV